MKFVRRNSLAVMLSASLLLCQRGLVDAQVQQVDDHSYVKDHSYIDTGEGTGAKGEPADVQMARAIAAGPPNVASSARIVGVDAQGKRMVLREGSNGFTCQPGDPTVVGRPASCSNEAARQWSADMAAHKPKPSNAEPGIVYMLAGATQRAVSGPSDETSPPITIGPRWMIMWPFDPKTTGLSAAPKDTGAYIMLAGTPYAHLHIMGQPAGTPMEHVAEHMRDDGGPAPIPSREIQMARAIAAGPKEITDQARIMGADAQGNRIVLREGNNDFICQPGKPQFVAQPASCYTTNSKPRITYMLAGATQRSISDPDDKTSAPLAIGPHWMIMMPFDPKPRGCRSPTAIPGRISCGQEPAPPTFTSWGYRRSRCRFSAQTAQFCKYLSLSPATALAVVPAYNTPPEAEREPI
jgi:hypothetical protein